MQRWEMFLLPAWAIAAAAVAGEPAYLDLAASGERCAWLDASKEPAVALAAWSDVPEQAQALGVVWWEERDVREICLHYAGDPWAGPMQVEYWALRWPADPPRMPTIEDPLDDIWQGSWLPAHTQTAVHGNTLSITFHPLAMDENPRAGNLPGVRYRRTLKLRLRLAAGAARPDNLQVFSESTIEPLTVRIELGRGERPAGVWRGNLTLSNGELRSARPWGFSDGERFEPPGTWSQVTADRPKGIVAELLSSIPAPAGSNDMTVVTVHAQVAIGGREVARTFSFNTRDLEHGSIDVPAFHVCISQADKAEPIAVPPGRKIRQQIPTEPEQTLARARREIPPLDPWSTQGGSRIYMPVAVDSSWQKFAVEYGGNIFLSKSLTKAKGAELARLGWPGDRLWLRIGTGREPDERGDRRVHVSMAEEFLPIVVQRWENEGLRYEEQAFATVLHGPLDPHDSARSEQTPGVLMVRLRAHNPGPGRQTAHVLLTLDPAEERPGRMAIAQGSKWTSTSVSRGKGGRGLACEIPVAPGATESLDVRLPFVSDLTASEAQELEALDHARERERVAAYWRELVNATTRFTTPEASFNHLARSVVTHIHLGTTKDPQSGLYMVPASSYGYQVFANESCFQILLLDALGDTRRAAEDLKTLVQLQGSRSFPGNYLEPHDGVYHGARVDAQYDYTAHQYGLDHGTVLWTLAEHYRYTHDKAWLEQNLPSMLKAVEWIERQRSTTRGRDLRGQRLAEYGLLPAGHLEDNPDWGYWFAVSGYCVAGMLELADALREIGHPGAAQMQAAATAFRNDFRTAVLRATEAAPVVRMRDGTYGPYVPTQAYQRFRYFGPLRVQYYSRYQRPDVLPCYRLSATREVLYGPMLLLSLGLFDADEPIADWILDDWEDNATLSSSGGFNVHGFTDDRYWFSQGGMVFQANLQNPTYVYLRRRETPAAIRGMYNNFAACVYPDVNMLTEEYRMWGHASGPFYKSPDEARFIHRVRDALVLEAGDELWLATGVPRRWLASREGINVERINSYFGPVAYSLRAGDRPGILQGRVTLPPRSPAGGVWLYARLPEGRPIRSVTLDGHPWHDVDAAGQRIGLPPSTRPMEIEIGY